MCALTISKTITQKNKHFQILITPRAAKLRIGNQTCYIFCTKVVTSQTLTQFSSGINFEGGPEGGFTSCSVTRCCFTRLARGRARSCRGTSRARAGLDVPILPKVLGGLGLHNGGPPRAGGGGTGQTRWVGSKDAPKNLLRWVETNGSRASKWLRAGQRIGCGTGPGEDRWGQETERRIFLNPESRGVLPGVLEICWQLS